MITLIIENHRVVIYDENLFPNQVTNYILHMPLKWLLFDLDNTLLDFDSGAKTALTETLVEYDFDEPEHLIASYHTINHQCWHRFEAGEIDIPTLKRLRFEIFVEENQLSVDPAILNRNYLDRLSQQVTEIEGARQVLDLSRQYFRLVLVTNGFAEVQHPRIQKSGLKSYFEHIIISEEVGSNKPAAAFFDHTFQLIKKPSRKEVMIIGDSLSSDIKGGSDYGINTCWFNPTEQKRNDKIIPDHTVSALAHIPAVWEKFS